LMNHELERIWKEAIVGLTEALSGICREEQKKTTKIFSQ
jgi:hypothetical protein